KSCDEDDDDEVDDKSDDQQDDDDQDDDDQDDNDDDQDTDNDDDDFIHPKLSIHKEEAKDEESFNPIVQTPKNSHDEGNDDASLVSSQFVTSMLNPRPDAGIDSLFESTPRVDVQASTTYAPFTLSTPTFPPPTIPTISQVPQAPTPLTTALSTFLQIMDQRMNEAVKVAIQIQSNKLRDKSQAKNEEFLNNLDENIQKIIKEQVKEQVKTSYVVAADLFEMELKKILIEKMESNKPIHQSDEQRNLYKALVDAYECDKIILDTYGDTVTLKRHCDDADKDEEPSARSEQGSKRKRKGKEPMSTSAPKEKATKTTSKSTKGSKSHQKTASESAPVEEPRQTTQYLEDPSHQEFKTYTLTPEFLAGPTYKLMKGSRKSLMELKLFLEEVYKATTDQLDWNNPEGQQYPHNLLKPLPLIPNSRGHRVIPFDHFINKDLEYLHGSASSRKYTTSVTKTKAAYYGHIKWIEDLIVEWLNYMHLDWITVRRDDDKLYKFKEGDFMRLHIQDIKDMLLLLVQGKLTNLTLNLTKPDTYRSDFKRKESYTAYFNSRGFIYQNKDKQNMLMWIEELHKFSDGTLNDVRTALDDRFKGIQMKYLPQAN
nr:hypothetical protein [Tanacetum cinerariifolium]